MNYKKLFFTLFVLLSLSTLVLKAQEGVASLSTYCNPLDLDYTYMIVNSHRNVSYRSGA